MNAKGNTFELISWVGIIIVALITGYWFFQHFSIGKASIEQIENDLKNIRSMVDDACETKSYTASYNPFVEDGNLEIRDGNTLCIFSSELRRCRTVLCEKLSATDENIDLSLVKKLEVRKESGNETVTIGAGGT